MIGVYALLVMGGWVFDIHELTRISSIGVSMRFITAVLFFFSTIGLYSISRAITYRDEVALLALAGVSMVILFMVTALFAGRSLGMPTGIESLFLHPHSSVDLSVSMSMQGRPSIVTLTSFALFGLVCIAALFLGDLTKKLIAYAGRIILSIGVIALAGYALNLPVLYYGTDLFAVPMALNTAVLFSLLGFGLMNIFKIPERKQ